MKVIRNKQSQGTSLIESMVVLSIIAIMCHIALYNYQPLIIENRLDNHIAKINRAVGLSRLSAVSHGSNVTLCALKHNKCEANQWHKELTVFTDSNKLGVLDDDDVALLNVDATHLQDKLTYPRTYLTFRNDGTPMGFHNGAFVYCPEYEKASHAGLAISISYTGRTKIRNTEKCLE